MRGADPDLAPRVSRTPAASVVVLSFNSAATLGLCLEALRPQVDELGAELVVVDNASEDESAAVAAAHADRVVQSNLNRGFSGGCNLGAANSDGTVVVLVNPDAELDPGCLRALVTAASDGLHSPVGGRAHTSSGSYDPRCAMGRPRLRAAICFALGLDTMFRGSRWFDAEFGPTRIEPGDGLVEVEAISGALFAVHREVWDRLGGLDERYFLYGEDVDFCVRSSERGWRPAVVAAAGYTHVGGMTADATTHRRVLLHRGKVELYRRHLSRTASTVAVLALQAGTLLRGAPAALPVARLSVRSRAWLDLFKRRREWRDGYTPRA